MKKTIVAIKDVVIGTIFNPYYAHNIEDAKRGFAYSINKIANEKENATPYKDYQLFSLGTFDDETGVIESKVEYICKAQDVLINREATACSTHTATDQAE